MHVPAAAPQNEGGQPVVSRSSSSLSIDSRSASDINLLRTRETSRDSAPSVVVQRITRYASLFGALFFVVGSVFFGLLAIENSTFYLRLGCALWIPGSLLYLVPPAFRWIDGRGNGSCSNGGVGRDGGSGGGGGGGEGGEGGGGGGNIEDQGEGSANDYPDRNNESESAERVLLILSDVLTVACMAAFIVACSLTFVEDVNAILPTVNALFLAGPLALLVGSTLPLFLDGATNTEPWLDWFASLLYTLAGAFGGYGFSVDSVAAGLWLWLAGSLVDVATALPPVIALEARQAEVHGSRRGR